MAHAQLLALGLSASAIGRRVDGGRLHRRYRGVYTVGHRRTGIEGDRAEQRRLLDFADLRELLARYPGRAGTPFLKALLASYCGPARRAQRA